MLVRRSLSKTNGFAYLVARVAFYLKLGGMMQHDKLVPQLLVSFSMRWVYQDGVVNWAHLLAGRRFIVADALGAAVAINLINLIPHRNCLIWALWLTHVTVDTFAGDEQRHDDILLMI